jgi:hypothetical protein
MMTET